jgi:hypothetical protein
VWPNHKLTTCERLRIYQSIYLSIYISIDRSIAYMWSIEEIYISRSIDRSIMCDPKAHPFHPFWCDIGPTLDEYPTNVIITGAFFPAFNCRPSIVARRSFLNLVPDSFHHCKRWKEVSNVPMNQSDETWMELFSVPGCAIRSDRASQLETGDSKEGLGFLTTLRIGTRMQSVRAFLTIAFGWYDPCHKAYNYVHLLCT